MVLISLHPFALRRMFLLVLALVGFSALCFADPVLMAHRYRHDHSRVATNASGMSTLRLNLTEAIQQNPVGNATLALENGQNRGSGASPLFFMVQTWDVRPETWTASTLLSPEAPATN